MALKILSADEALIKTTLVSVIYSPPGMGKTTLAQRAEKTVLFDFDKGAHRSLERGASVQIQRWEQVAAMAESDLSEYSHVVVDTGGAMLDCAADFIMRNNPKMGRGGGQLSLQGFGELGAVARAFIAQFGLWGKNLTIVCHSKEEKKGDDTRTRLLMQGQTVNLVCQMADVIGLLSKEGDARKLVFAADETSYTKSPVAWLDVVEVPKLLAGDGNNFFGDLQRKIIDGINEKNKGSDEGAAKMKSALEIAGLAQDGTGLNEAIELLTPYPDAPKKMAFAVLQKKAKEIGFAFDAKAKKFAAIKVEEQTSEGNH